jgi:hypothetical protein
VRSFPSRLFVSAAAILGFTVLSGHAAEGQKLTGHEAEAVALAVNTFQSEHRKDPNFYGDLRHYSVFLERMGTRVDVTFVPDRSPRPSNIPKGQPYLELGGSSVYGSEVHYIIALDRMKILKEHYAR